jgi:hypothetical protein
MEASDIVVLSGSPVLMGSQAGRFRLIQPR